MFKFKEQAALKSENYCNYTEKKDFCTYLAHIL